MRASLFSLHYAWEPCLWKQRVMGGGQKGRGYGSHTRTHTRTRHASQGRWPTPTKPKILIKRSPPISTFKSSSFNTNGSWNQTKWEVGGVSSASVGALSLSLSDTLSCTNLRTHTHTQTYIHTLFVLVVFKPAEISYKSVKSLPAFTLAGKKKKKRKTSPLSLSLLAAGDKSLLFLSLSTSPSLLPSANCVHSPFVFGCFLIPPLSLLLISSQLS